jgi:DNA-binding transcriptional ArsR family regulator
VLRIHFTAEDVGKVRMASQPDPMWETVFSIFRLRYEGPPAIFGTWQRSAAAAIRRADLDLLLPLVPGGYFPDFLTPAEGAAGFEAGLEALLRTPKTRLCTELNILARQQKRLPGWMSALAEGDVAVLRRVGDAVRSHHRAAVAPIWPQIRAHIDADRSKRARAFLAGGCEGLLDSFRPMMRWEPPFLTIDTFRYEREVRLDGRGLLLTPAYLSWNSVDVLRDPALPPVLVYPIERDPAVGLSAGASVVALIGSTRAAILETIGEGRTTTELARRVGVSPASISQHTAVLREAGLIRTSRVGKAVLHTMTALGAALLD